jgi:hypothetical protein
MIPPIFIINGTEDTLSPVENARNLVAHLDGLGTDEAGRPYPYLYMEVEGAGHSFIPGSGLGVTPPPFAGSPQDEFQGWSNTEVNGKTVEAHCFEFFYEHLALSELAEPSMWEGFPLNESGWVNTGDWMGWLNVTDEPWIWSLSLETFLFLPEGSLTDNGAWFFAPRR